MLVSIFFLLCPEATRKSRGNFLNVSFGSVDQQPYRPQNVQFILESSGFFCQTRQLIVAMLDLDQLFLQLFTVDPVVVLGGLQSTKTKL